MRNLVLYNINKLETYCYSPHCPHRPHGSGKPGLGPRPYATQAPIYDKQYVKQLVMA